MSHAMSPLSETGRLRLARCVVVQGWTLARAASYPRAFPDRDTCQLAAAFATGDHAYINSIIKAVSDALIAAAEDAGAGWVDVYEASRGHDICSQTPWINGVTTDLTRANPPAPVPRGAGGRGPDGLREDQPVNTGGLVLD